MNRVWKSSLAFALFALASAAPAQDYSQYYTVTHPTEFTNIHWAFFYKKASELTAETQGAFPHYLDLSYGPRVKQRVDVYLPKGKVSGAPVLLFIHGGGKREGDKAQYGFVAAPFAEKGIVTVVMSYRLWGGEEPIFFPAQEDDVKQAIIWVHGNIAKYGGDPDRLYVAGHSNGAHLTSFVGFARSWLADFGLSPSMIKGIAPLSVLTNDITQAAPGSTADQYAPTPLLKKMASPALNASDPAPYVILQYGQKEATDQRVEAVARMKTLFDGKGVHTQVVVEPGVDHDGAALALGDKNTATFKAILAMIQGARPRSQ